MPNQIQFSVGGNARPFYLSLDPKQRRSLDRVLDYIRDFPFEHGDVVTKRYTPPVVLYIYADDCWRVSYTLDKYPRQPLWNNINVFAMARVRDSV